MTITFMHFYSMSVKRAELYYMIVPCHHSPRVDRGGPETWLCYLRVQGRTSRISLGMIRPSNIVNPDKQSLTLYPLPTTCYVLTLCSYTVCTPYITVSNRLGMAFSEAYTPSVSYETRGTLLYVNFNREWAIRASLCHWSAILVLFFKKKNLYFKHV